MIEGSVQIVDIHLWTDGGRIITRYFGKVDGACDKTFAVAAHPYVVLAAARIVIIYRRVYRLKGIIVTAPAALSTIDDQRRVFATVGHID